jgi:Cu(I)/Ag(I) efflux system periplasmic protein CusF
VRRFITVAALVMFSTTAIAESAPVLGSVTKIDQKQGKITLKHGPIKNLEMDAMTMVFAVGDPTMLKTVKVGDKVKFEADRVNGRITVTKLEKAK